MNRIEPIFILFLLNIYSDGPEQCIAECQAACVDHFTRHGSRAKHCNWFTFRENTFTPISDIFYNRISICATKKPKLEVVAAATS